LRVQFKGSLIHPLRMKGERDGLPKGLKNIEAQAAGFGPRGCIHAQQPLAKLRRIARQRLKLKENVNAHGKEYITSKKFVAQAPTVVRTSILSGLIRYTHGVQPCR